jgi:uncharacterized membrane protein YfhO
VVAPAGGTFLVFATAFYPGWRATVDGNEVAVQATNGAVMGLEVPEGTHQVELTFTDPGFGTGLLSTLLGLLVLAGLWFVTRPRLADSPAGS